MGKIHNKIAERGNHKRQAQQAHLILHDWRATAGGGAVHEEHGHLWKDASGECWFSSQSARLLFDLVEWDDVHTRRVKWLYNNLLGRRLI